MFNALFILLALPAAAQQSDGYFKEIAYGPRQEFVFKKSVSAAECEKSFCYHVYYGPGGKTASVVYTYMGKMKDGYMPLWAGHARAVAQISVSYNKEGERRDFLDARGKPAPEVSAVELKFDAVKNELSLYKYERRTRLLVSPDEPAIVRTVFNKAGLVVEERFYSHRDKLKPYGTHAYSVYRAAYDSAGRKTEESWLDADGTPVPNHAGVAVVKYIHSGSQTESRYYDASGNLIGEASPWSAIVRKTFDSTGRVTEETRHDAGGKLSVKDAIPQLRYKYDAAGNKVREVYYGHDGRLKENREGVALITMKYDSRGNKVEESFYGADKKLKLNARLGLAIRRYVFDDVGNQIEMRHYGTDGRLREDANGVAIIKLKPNGRGGHIEISHYGADGRLKENAAGAAVVQFVENEKGEIVEKRHLGADGKPKNDNSGVALTRYDRDELGQVTNERYYNAKGEEIKTPAGKL